MALKRWMLLSVLICACVLPAIAPADVAEQTLLVVPARYTVLQFSFDMARMRPVYLVAYDTEGKAGDLVLYVWDSQAGEWLRTSLDEYRSGAIFMSKPKRVIVVGPDRDLPTGLTDASAWGGEVDRIPSMKIVDMVNGMNAAFNFSNHEWRRLAKRYKLTLNDRNAERRRYGRYGPPGGKKTEPQMPGSEPDDVVMPMSLDVPEVVPVMPEEPELGEVKPVVEEKGAPEPVLEEKGVPEAQPVVEEKGMPEPEDIAPEDK